MAANNLSIDQVSTLLNRKNRTVRIWRCKSSGRQIPADQLELLKFKVAEAERAQ